MLTLPDLTIEPWLALTPFGQLFPISAAIRQYFGQLAAAQKTALSTKPSYPRLYGN
jgi:hypothetical protein